MSLSKEVLLAVSFMILLAAGTAANAQGWQTIYQQDFSTDPGWTTNNSSRYYWDSATGTYYANAINVNNGGYYAYYDLDTVFSSFKLEYDIKANSVNYAGGAFFGLYDSDMRTQPDGSSIFTNFSREDRGQTVFVETMNSSNVSYRAGSPTPKWTAGVWYHTVMEYDASTLSLNTQITRRDTGALLSSITATGIGPFASDMDRVGTSQKRSGTFQVPGAQSWANIDNVAVSVPKPHQPELYAVLVGGTGNGRRGDIDAEHIRSALLRFQGVKSDNITVATSGGELDTAMASVTSKIQPGDTLLFFYAGHGVYMNNGTEPSVANSAAVERETGDEFNTGDEYLALEGSWVSDDRLTTLLSSDSKLAQVNKVAILDSCFSGGFWGQPGNDTDDGDLDKLSRVAIIASATEDKLSYYFSSSVPLVGGRGFLSIALENTLDDLATGDPLAFTLSALELGLTARYTNSNFPDSGSISGTPWLDSEITLPIEGLLDTFRGATSDFDTSANLVPEPATLSLLALSGLALIRRRRK